MSETIRLADEYIEFRQSTDHIRAMWSGDIERLDGWEDHTEEGMEERRSALLDFAGKAASGVDDETMETVVFTARSIATQLEWRDELHLTNPEIGIHALLLTFLPRYPLRTADHGERYLAKIAAMPAMFEGLNSRLVAAAKAGKVPPAPLVAETIARIDRHLEAAVDPLEGQPAPTNEVVEDWGNRLAARVKDYARPALRSFRDTLETHSLPAAPSADRPGLIHMPGGAEAYDSLITAHTSLTIDAETVHQIGLEQVARLEEEYLELAGPLLGTKSLDEIYSSLREDPDLHYQSADKLVSDARTALRRATEAMPGWFGVMPEADCEARSIDQGPLAFYSRPVASAGKPGVFYFNTSDPSMWGTFQLEATTFHEGIPGHHLQLALALEQADLHEVHSKLYLAAYNEGWGLYTERLSDEMGLYSSDLDRVGMLAADSMRACRLVVDSGMHGLGWTRDHAIQYMYGNSPMTLRQVTGEIDRYIGDPGQALGYMIGRLEIESIRTSAEEQLGARFDIKAFHDTVLVGGAVPLSTLRRRVARWAESA